MPANHEHHSALGQLQSADQAELLDAIDKLRSEAFQHELTLPQLIVCGDQSSGKSSVLEAISRVRFPARGTFCTTFATELKLRSVHPGAKTNILVSIQPAEARSDQDKSSLRDFKPTEELKGLEDLPKVIADVSKQLNTLSPNQRIYEDKLLVTVYGPELPNLTLVDLPGIFHASNDGKTQEDIRSVENLVKSYMQNENSIILAVLPAINDFDNQVVLELVKNIDKGGQRTLGIITKPDKLDSGDALEHSVIQYAKNLRFDLELGWHVLRNRSSGQEHVSADERDSLEAQFFAQDSASGWKAIPKEDLGADALRTKLANILLSAIGKSLPCLVREIHSAISTYQKDLESLGEPKVTDSEKREELQEITLRLDKLVAAAIQGNYSSSSFFDHPIKDKQATRRLRANLRDTLDDFAGVMYERGHLYNLETESSPGVAHAPLNWPSVDDIFNLDDKPEKVSKNSLLEAIDSKIKESRGSELDGLIPPPVIAQVFHSLSSKWALIADRYLGRCHQAVQRFFQEAIHQSAPTHIASRVISDIVSHRFEHIKEILDQKLRELLKPYRSTYLVTTQDIRTYTGERDARTSRAEVVYQYVEWYYSLARATFTENIAALAVESCLVAELDTVFTFKTIAGMSNESVEALTKEPQDVARNRRRYQERLKTLRGVSRICMKHVDSFCIPLQINVSASKMAGSINTENPAPKISVHDEAPPQKPERMDRPRKLSEHDIPGYPSPPKTPSRLSGRADGDETPQFRKGRVLEYGNSPRSAEKREKSHARRQEEEANSTLSLQPHQWGKKTVFDDPGAENY